MDVHWFLFIGFSLSAWVACLSRWEKGESTFPAVKAPARCRNEMERCATIPDNAYLGFVSTRIAATGTARRRRVAAFRGMKAFGRPGPTVTPLYGPGTPSPTPTPTRRAPGSPCSATGQCAAGLVCGSTDQVGCYSGKNTPLCCDPSPSGPCHTVCTRLGSCNADAEVTIDELIVLVNIALGRSAADVCCSGDANADGQVTTDEILRAVSCAQGDGYGSWCYACRPL